MQVTLRNAISNFRQTIDISDIQTQTVQQVVENSGLLAAGAIFSVRDVNGRIVDDVPIIEFAGSTLSVGLPGDHISGGGPGTLEEIAIGFLALKVLGPFAEAFASKLGERFGEATATVLSKIRWQRRHGPDPAWEELTIGDAEVETTIIIAGPLSDDAYLALIDLDMSDEGIRGKRLRWDYSTKTWRPW